MRRADALHVDKPDGTAVDYFLFDEFEVHWNTIAPGATQPWHHHTQIEEAIVVTYGMVDVISETNGSVTSVTAREGDLVRVLRSLHTLANPTPKPAGFVVFRFVPDGVSKAEIIKNDKTVDPAPGDAARTAVGSQRQRPDRKYQRS